MRVMHSVKNKNKLAGKFGSFGCFSLHFKKSKCMGRRRVLVANKKLYNKMKLLRNHVGNQR